MSHIQERFYTYITFALHENSDPEKKYFFDRDDNTLFVLGFKKGQYRIHDKIPQLQTADKKKRLNEKISKVVSNHKSILELKNLENAIKIGYLPNRREVDLQQHMKLGKEQFEITQEFIERNHIDMLKVDVLE